MAAYTNNENMILSMVVNDGEVATIPINNIGAVNYPSTAAYSDFAREYGLSSFEFRGNPVSLNTSNDICGVNIIRPNRVVETTFYDGKKVKTVCQHGDKFSLETALYIAIAKHEFGSVYTNAGIEKLAKENLPYMKKYEKIVRHGLSLYKADEKRKQDNIRKKISEADIRHNREKKRKAKFARKKQQQIDMLAEAIVKANNSAKETVSVDTYVAKRHKHE